MAVADRQLVAELGTQHEGGVARLTQTITLALLLGVACGFLEALVDLATLWPRWLPWDVFLFDVALRKLATTIGFNAAIFLLFGLLLTGMARTIPRVSGRFVLFSGLLLLLFFTLLDQTQRLRMRSGFILGLALAIQVARWLLRRPNTRLARFQRVLRPLAMVALLSTAVLYGGSLVRERIGLARLPAISAQAPNVLLIVLDTARADHFSTYGYERQTSPFVDSLAAKGVVFEHAYAASSWTLPSHATLFSGRLPHQHHVREPWGQIRALDPRFSTLAEVLRRSGYATGGFAANPWYCSPRQGFSRGFLRYRDFSNRVDAVLPSSVLGRRIMRFLRNLHGWYRDPDALRAGEVTRDFGTWLDTIGKRPFFGFLNYMEMHGPVDPPAEFANRFVQDPARMAARNPVDFMNANTRPLSPEELQLELDAYDASLAHLDKELEKLFAELERRGLNQNAVILLTSDHGESFGENGLYAHRTSVYTAQVGVPLIVYGPGRVPAGLRVRTPVSQQAIPATILALTEGSREGIFPGYPLTDAWEAPARLASVPVLVEVDGAPFPHVPAHWPVRQGWQRSLLMDHWQFVLNENGRMELYDLAADPLNEVNLVDSPTGKPIADTMKQKLEQSFREDP